MRFRVQFHLAYNISSAASVLFNIAVAKNRFQQVTEENFSHNTNNPFEEFMLGPEGSRFYRLKASRGILEISYSAAVEAFHETMPPESLRILRLDEVPPEVLVYIADKGDEAEYSIPKTSSSLAMERIEPRLGRLSKCLYGARNFRKGCGS